MQRKCKKENKLLQDNIKSIFFVAEIKGSKNVMQLRDSSECLDTLFDPNPNLTNDKNYWLVPIGGLKNGFAFVNSSIICELGIMGNSNLITVSIHI